MFIGSLVLLLLHFSTLLRVPRKIAPVTVNWGTPLQVIDGFGAMYVSRIPITPQQADFFFSPRVGIGLSIVRTGMIPTLTDCQDTEIYLGASPSNCFDVVSGPTALVADLGAVQAAIARGVKSVFTTSGSPPGSMKTSPGLYYKGSSFVGNASNYSSLASIFASACNFYAANNIPITAFSPQNEPDQNTSYTSALWTATQFHDFVPYMYSALTSSSCPNAKILFPEVSTWTRTYGGLAGITMSDASVAPKVGFLAMHDYGGNTIVAPTNYGYGQHVWLTEVSGISGAYDGSIGDALNWATIIHESLTVGGVSAWLYFSLVNTGPLSVNDNEGLTDQSGNIAKRAYMMGNWSKFVRPGSHMVGVTNTGSLLVTAFVNTTATQSAVVVINDGKVTSNMSIVVGTQMGSLIIPWVTSATHNLAQQDSIPVTNGTVSYAIPAQSIVTLQGN